MSKVKQWAWDQAEKEVDNIILHVKLKNNLSAKNKLKIL